MAAVCEPSPDIIYIDKWEPVMYSSMFSRTFFSGKVCIIHYRPHQCNPWKFFCIACSDAKMQHSGRRGELHFGRMIQKERWGWLQSRKIIFEVQGQSKRSSEPEGWGTSALSSAGSFQILAIWMLTMHLCYTYLIYATSPTSPVLLFGEHTQGVAQSSVRPCHGRQATAF